MKKITILTASLALAVILGFAATVNTGHEPGHDTCELGAGNEAGDIYNLAATYDAANDLIVVEMLLCGTLDTKIKYRVHFDHTAPYFDDADRDGDNDPPGEADADDFCFTTSDDSMKHRGNKDTGPGTIVLSTTTNAVDTLTYTVPVDDLNPALMLGDTVYIWADTQYKGSLDRVPNTDGLIDGCSKPEVAAEVLALTLEPPFKTVFVTSTLHNGNLGGLAGADAICNTLAVAAGLPGTFLAWLSNSSGNSPSTRFTQSSQPYKLVDGTTVADNYADLTDGSLDAPIDRTEQSAGLSTFNRVWTGTSPSGAALSDHCSNWTDNTPFTFRGTVGIATSVNSPPHWTTAEVRFCHQFRRIYCFEQ